MTSSDSLPIKRALISVSDKRDVTALARFLSSQGVELISTGGTAKALREGGIPVREIADYTQAPEIFDGRLKSIHPRVHGGILARRDVDQEVLEEQNIKPIDLVVINLYPFEESIKDAKCTLNDAIEQIDIGGPSLIRAAAKNYRWVTVITDPRDYPKLKVLMETGTLTEDARYRYAVKAFSRTAAYEAAICNYLSAHDESGADLGFPKQLNQSFVLGQTLRYGENPHQVAAMYQTPSASAEQRLTNAQLCQGKPLSYNNYLDAEAAWSIVKRFEAPTAAIVKHGGPCGVASDESLENAYKKAFAADSQSAFGGVIALNRCLDEATAKAIFDSQFAEVIIAPTVDDDALKILGEKPQLRVLAVGADYAQTNDTHTLRAIDGGLLVQSRDDRELPIESWKTVTTKTFSDQEMADAKFAWSVVKHARSNAIVLAKNTQTLGVGAGQTSRVFAIEIAGQKAAQAKLDLTGAVLASDGFFPFEDNIEAVAKLGVKAIIQPGGSKRDEEVIAAANAAGIAMIFTGTRHFTH